MSVCTSVVSTPSPRDRRRDTEKATKAARANAAEAKPDYQSHEQKIKDRANVIFSPGAARRLNGMKLHGKGRKDVKKFHTNIMKGEMETNGALVCSALAHDGGTVRTEENHITAQFQNKNGRLLPSKWTDRGTGEERQGDKHHVYTKGRKAPRAWTTAVAASEDRQAATEAAKKAKEDLASKAKAEASRAAGEGTSKTMSEDEKYAQRAAKKAANAARKTKGGS